MLHLSPRRVFSFVTVAALLASADASAACRERTTPVPAGAPLGVCDDDGLALYWPGRCVGYSLSTHASRELDAPTASAVAARAFAHWTGIECAGAASAALTITASNLGLVECNTHAYVGDQPNQNLIFFSDDAWPYGDATDLLGKTFLSYDATTGQILDADIAINTHEFDFATADPIPADGYDLEGILTHEIGHFLGLAHSDQIDSVMYPDYAVGSTSMRRPTADDVAGLCSIYLPDDRRSGGSIAAPTTFAAAACDPTPHGGLGSKCPSPGGCASSPERQTEWSSLVVVAVVVARLRAKRFKARSS